MTSERPKRAWFLGTLFAASLVATACRGTAHPSAAGPSATPSVPATTTATTAAAALPAKNTPDPTRAMQHLKVLAGDIGIRASTTDNERRAADYIRSQLEAAGYQANLETFDVQATLGGTASVRHEDGSTTSALPMNASPDGTASARLVLAGLGRSSDYAGVAANGAVVLVDRGEVAFAEKARAAQGAGAVALIVANNQAGPFRGDLGSETAHIPVVGIASEDAAVLRALAGHPVTVTAQTLRASGPSQNVVGKPSAAPCTAYMGAHYDSVLAGPGANDNASGTSLLLEVARARRLDGLCVIAFGSEEVGLVGSKAYVKQHDVTGGRFMLNFDMVSKITNPALIGDGQLTARASTLATSAGFTLRTITSLGPGASSDYASFQAAGVPALFFYAGDDPFIHTAQDDVTNTSQADLAKFLNLAVAVIDDLYAR